MIRVGQGAAASAPGTPRRRLRDRTSGGGVRGSPVDARSSRRGAAAAAGTRHRRRSWRRSSRPTGARAPSHLEPRGCRHCHDTSRGVPGRSAGRGSRGRSARCSARAVGSGEALPGWRRGRARRRAGPPAREHAALAPGRRYLAACGRAPQRADHGVALPRPAGHPRRGPAHAARPPRRPDSRLGRPDGAPARRDSRVRWRWPRPRRARRAPPVRGRPATCHDAGRRRLRRGIRVEPDRPCRRRRVGTARGDTPRHDMGVPGRRPAPGAARRRLRRRRGSRRWWPQPAPAAVGRNRRHHTAARPPRPA